MYIGLSIIPDTELGYLPGIRRKYYLAYWVLAGLIILGSVAMSRVKVTIAVTGAGITRPLTERTEIRSVISGIVDSIYYREGDIVPRNAILLRIHDSINPAKLKFNRFQTDQTEAFIADLSYLTQTEDITGNMFSHLRSPLYREQVSRFLRHKAEQDAIINKARKELEMNTDLARDKVISQKEFFDIQNNYEKVQSTYKASVLDQLSNWQADLARLQLQQSQNRQDMQQVHAESKFYEIRSPVSGIVQGINGRYAGGYVQANETVCTISPEGDIIGECYVSTKDIGLVRKGQIVHFQVDAFDYNYFGVLTGKVVSIDNDFTLVDNKPVLKTRCSFDSSQVRLRNGFTGKLRKGLTFQARFLVTERSIWQLLWDKMDNWFNPSAPST